METVQGALVLGNAIAIVFVSLPLQRRVKMQNENVKTEEMITTTEEKGISNSKKRDSSSKIIFGNPKLCAQFLKGYTEIPFLKDVEPEDIEDVSERYVRMFREERNSDVVKKVRIKDSEVPFYLISLIEYKSNVDYNVVMQMLRYMVCIWEEYEKEAEKQHKGISKTKDFRYPMILPIVFYDGVKKWTAALKMQERIDQRGGLSEYIPDFKCLLISPRDYSNVQLMERGDILSVIMMIDKIQNQDDFRSMLANVPDEYLEEVVKDAPEELKNITADVIDMVTANANLPEQERAMLRGYVKEDKMGELFSHMKGYDIQATRAEARAEGKAQERENGIEKMVKFAKELGIDKERTVCQLAVQYELTELEAIQKVDQNWD